MLTTEQAAHLVLATAISKAISEAVEDVRAELRPDLNPGDRTTAIVNGVTVGHVSLTQTKAATKVQDYAALMAWALEHVPGAIVTTQTLNSSWVATLLKGDGTWTDPATGEVYEVPGLGTSQATPQLRVIPTDAGTAWAQYALGIAMSSPLALTGGTDA